MNSDISISAASMAKNLTMHVTMTGVQRFRVRMWIASKLMALAAKVAGMGLSVDMAQSRNMDTEIPPL